MAKTKPSEIANGTGKIYEVRAGKVLQSFPNNRTTVDALLIRALGSAIIYPQNTGLSGSYTESATDPNRSTFYCHAIGGAADKSGDLIATMSADALDITRYLLEPSKNPASTVAISGGVLTIERFSRVTVVVVTPESGTEDTLDSVIGMFNAADETDFQEGDIVHLIGDEANIITVAHGSSGNGHIRTRGEEGRYIQGYSSAISIVKRNGPGWQELGAAFEPLQVVKVNSATSYDPLTQCTSDRMEVWLQNSGALASAVVIGSTDPKIGTKIIVRPVTAYSSYGVGGSLTIFGVTIPSSIGTTTNWWVEAIWDSDSSVWRGWLVSLMGSVYTVDGTIAAATTVFTNQLLVGKATKDFVLLVDGVAVTFDGANASGSFNTGTGQITFTSAVQNDVYYHLTINKIL
ncbi:MAG TPA: hypothetical protein PLJ00_05850 [Chitinophagales bacterium]|nr:hypothetical protein [Chitinophagales bacterium]